MSNIKVLRNTGQLVTGESYELDFNHQFLETVKYDAKMTNKKDIGYSPSVAFIGDLIVGIENRNNHLAMSDKVQNDVAEQDI